MVRLGLGAASSALIVSGIVGFGDSGVARADSGPFQGSAYAQSLQITPHEGSLAVGAIMGVAIAGNTDTFSRAQSEGIDLGAVGESMKGDNCGSPPNPTVVGLVPDPLIAESGNPGAAAGESQGPSQSTDFSTEHVLAAAIPFSQSDTTYAGPFAAPGSALAVSGLHSSSWSGINNGITGSGASSTIGSLSIGGNMVVLNGLQWQAVYPTGSSAQPSGTFSIGQVVLSGKALPTTPDISAVQTAVNAVLGTIGIQLQLPQVSTQGGVLTVSPLVLQVVPNTLRDSLIDPALNGVQPFYYQVANGLENGFAADNPPLSSLGAAEKTAPGQQLASALCQSDTPITVADVTLAAFDGGGFFSASIGGVNASSGPLAANDFNLTPLGVGDLSSPGSTQFIPGTLGSTDTSGALSAPSLGDLGGSTAGPATTPTTTPPAPQAPVRESLGGAKPAGFTSGGPLLAAGLGGLALLLLLIEGDRRMMRRLQRRAIPLEE
ncbi:MAG TPA: hypothetical protein VNG12_03840 [Acidimicrobiales bacterium]|nr:hypothetical protein [Acidimicrobiales bacterium]